MRHVVELGKVPCAQLPIKNVHVLFDELLVHTTKGEAHVTNFECLRGAVKQLLPYLQQIRQVMYAIHKI